MCDLARHLRHVLSAYLARGDAALALLADGAIDAATPVLAARTAAFHNFRAADHLAVQRGLDIAQDPEAQALMRRVAEQDAALKTALAEAKAQTLHQLSRIRLARQAIPSFKSAREDPATFAKSA